MKKFFTQLFDQFTVTCLITNIFNLFICLLAISLGEESWLSLRKSVHGLTGGTKELARVSSKLSNRNTKL
jgi:hypothetical protein